MGATRGVGAVGDSTGRFGAGAAAPGPGLVAPAEAAPPEVTAHLSIPVAQIG